VQRDQRIRGDGLVHQKRDGEQPAREQQAGHHPGIEPIEPIALIEAGIEEAETDPCVDNAGPIGSVQQVAVDRPARHRDGGGLRCWRSQTEYSVRVCEPPSAGRSTGSQQPDWPG
jgi:hypothetical protein